MSKHRYSAIPLCAIGAQMTASAWQVLAALGKYLNANWQAYPGYGALARDTGMSHRQVARALHELKCTGIVTWEQRFEYGSGGKLVQKSNFYTIHCDAAPVRRNQVGGSVTGDRGGSVTGDRGGSDPSVTLTTHMNYPVRTSARPSDNFADGASNDDFKRFWNVFPRRQGSSWQYALQEWHRARAAGANPEAIIVAARAYATAVAEERRRPLLRAHTWLKRGDWKSIAANLEIFPKKVIP